MLGDSGDISAIAAAQRDKNARYTITALGSLTTLSVPAAHFLGAPASILAVLGGTALAQAIGYLFVKTGQGVVGVLIAVVSLLFEHVGCVAALEGQLGPMPYISPLVLLVVAATATSRWLWPALGLTLTALALEAVLSPCSAEDRAAIVTSALLVVLVFVISLLHVRGTERAFEEAEDRERRRADARRAANESERLYRLIADHTDDLISLVDHTGRALYLSPSHERLLGIAPQSAIGHRAAAFLQLNNREEAANAFKKALAEGESYLQLRVQFDNSEMQLDSRLTRIPVDGEVLIAVISRDVTQRKTLEQRLIENERLEALGRLAGSVAHDFNNLLMVVGGAAELARELLPPCHASLAELDAVLDATATARRLTEQLLTFSRHELTVPVELDLKESLEQHRELLQRMVGKEVTLSFELDAALPRVMIPSSHFEQLFMNLSVNARDAMPEGGQLTYRLAEIHLETGDHGVSKAGSYVAFSVEDQGVGIPHDALDRVFEPSFTTKRTGTGLGLSTCHGIVSRLGGGIRVESEAGRGTTMTFFLPIGTPHEPQSDSLRRTAAVRHVLIVDDERSVRDTTARMLRFRGLDVLTASSVVEAQRLLEDSSTMIDAIVTDIVLSEDRGTDLLQTCAALRPEAMVVVVSGYTPDINAAASLSAHGARFLPKPFSIEQLLKALDVSTS